MRRALLIAVFALVFSAGTLLHGQVAQPNGVPAFHSCCAIGMFGPSVPAGSIGVPVNSLHSFNSFNGNFRHDGFRRDGGHRRRFHNFYGNSGYPIYYAPYSYGYGYGYYDDTNNVDANAPANSYEQPVNNDEAPGMTVFERRRTYDLIGDDDKDKRGASDDRYGEHYTDSREQRGASEDREQKSTPAEPQKTPPEETISTILVFRDGSHREVRNYALMGNSIYDLGVKPGQGKMKILLADLDIPATIAANDQRGIEFKPPKQ
jgi:hypothetical protein